MSSVNTQGNQILVDSPEDTAELSPYIDKGSQLATWIEGKTTKWEDYRNNNYNDKWAEYWRMWRGQWASDDKNRNSERSRLIAPALSQAIEMTVAEAEEALLSKDVWIDLSDDIADEEKFDALITRDQLLEDLDLNNSKDVISEVVFTSALFGTGVMMINTTVTEEKELARDPVSNAIVPISKEKVNVRWESVRPDEFIPDPAGTCISDMLGCARKVTKPMHSILEKIEEGVYRREALGALAPHNPTRPGYGVDHETEGATAATFTQNESDSVEITEYHGKIPALLFEALNDDSKDSAPLDALLIEDVQRENDTMGGDGPLVEAIVTIASGGILLRAMINPYVMTDRSVIAFQFEKVPGRFWGRGVAEKGYNPQKALDAEMRARIDALGYISSPMIGIDSGKIPRGFKMEVKPGKVWLTQGDPDTVVKPISIGQVQPNTFNQTAELIQMIQMGTGAFDTATPLSSTQSGGAGATSNSALLGAYVKRAKRAVQNISRNLIDPAIKKTLWRYMQFDPARYPTDSKLRVSSTLGIVAREVEQIGLTQLMGMMPQEFPEVTLAVAKGIMDMSSVTNKSEIVQAFNEATAPPSEEEQARQAELQQLQDAVIKAEAEASLLDNQKVIAEIREIESEAAVQEKRSQYEGEKVQVERSRVFLQAAEIKQFEKQNEIANRRTDLQERQLQLKEREASRKS